MLYISPRIRRLIDIAIDEDEVGFDVASAVFFEDREVQGRLVAKQALTVAGLAVVDAVFNRIDPRVEVAAELEDGASVSPGDLIATVSGPAVSVLRGERVALNFLQRMSAIATATAAYARALQGSRTRVVDTRKTLPGYRELDKYAVRCGGGGNHRFNLSGGVMIKDNHIAAAGSIAAAVAAARARAPFTLKIEVETTSTSQVLEALAAQADIIMLDNMSTDAMREAIALIRERAGDRVAIEASGNITAERLPALADLGLDYISVGALTHSVRAADISMRF